MDRPAEGDWLPGNLRSHHDASRPLIPARQSQPVHCLLEPLHQDVLCRHNLRKGNLATIVSA
jgi:hypothetical protein